MEVSTLLELYIPNMQVRLSYYACLKHTDYIANDQEHTEDNFGVF